MDKPERKLLRLPEYDYSTPGAYFVTICSHKKECVFGRIIPGDGVGEACMKYSAIGNIARECLLDVESHYENIHIDNWVIMPNHIHLLIRIAERTNSFPTASYDIPNVIGKYKAAVSRTVRNGIHFEKLWQTSFYDHVVRNDDDYQSIWQYISGNPSKWLEDCFYVE